MTPLADLLDRLDTAMDKAVKSGEVGVVRSLRMHVGGAAADLPTSESLLAMGDRLFACPRARETKAAGAMLCEWDGGQIAAVSSSPAQRSLVVLTVLGSEGALHFHEQAA